MTLSSSKLTSPKLALTLATLALLTACNQQPKTDGATDKNKDSTTQTTSATSSTTTTVVESSSTTAPTSATPASSEVATTTTTTTTTTQSATAPTATSATATVGAPEKSELAKDLVAFNTAISATAMKSQKVQADFIQKHKADKSPNVQTLFIKEGIKSLDQQKADLQAVKLTDPKVIALRNKFISAIEQQKSTYTFMVNTPKPTQAQQDDVAKQMANIQKTGEEAQQTFLQLAQEAGLQPKANPAPAGKSN